jgi:hypothetical protein
MWAMWWAQGVLLVYPEGDFRGLELQGGDLGDGMMIWILRGRDGAQQIWTAGPGSRVLPG